MSSVKSSKKPQGFGSKSDENGQNGGGFGYKIEPALFVHFMASLMIFMVLQNLMTEKACSVDLGYSSEVCSALKSKTRPEGLYVDEENQVQKLVGSLMLLRTVLENVFPMFLVLLIGAWSDKYGRKLPMLFVVSGFILQNFLLIFCHYFNWAGARSIAIVSSLIPGLSGHQAVFSMAAFTYITDTTPVDKRTLRTSLAHSSLFLGVTVGLGLGGFLASSSFTYTQIFVFGIFLELLVFTYIYLVIQSEGSGGSKNKSVGQMFSDIFMMQHVKDAFQAVARPRERGLRKKLIILLLCHFCAFAPLLGEMTVLFLFGRYKFNWGGSELGSFMTFRTTIGFLGNFITMGFLSSKLKLSDPAVGICGSLSIIAASIYYTFVQTPSLMYLGPFLGILGGANMIVPRSILSKLMPPSEMGKVSSFLGCLDSMGPLISGPLYTLVYTNTFTHSPPAFFYISASLMIPLLLSYTYFLLDAKKSMSAQKDAHKKSK